jgi:hypothetical protein
VIALSELSVIIETLKNLERMHQLNLELLEQLDVVFKWLIRNDIAIQNMDKLNSLLTKTQALLAEVYSSSPKTLQYQKINRRKVTDFKNDGEVTEPFPPLYKGGIVFSEHKRG